MSLKILAPAKINLGLEIGKKNIDGYHEVDMIMQSVSFYDEIELSMSGDKNIEVITDKKIDCPPEKNIAYRAAQEFFKYTKIKSGGIKIGIKKRIPMFAGLAGGSADGAGVIVGLDRMFETHLNISQMCEIGSKVGSDVPFCIGGGAACAKGTGTDLTSINSMPKCIILLVKPDFSVSTSEAYSRFDDINLVEKHDMGLLKSAMINHNLGEICNNLYNRFEEVINIAEISEIKRKLKKIGALGTLMTGSGSAIYGIFDDMSKAKVCQKKLQNEYQFVGLAKPVNHGAFLM